jgi:SAM-dependent methyltransferase
MTKANSYSRSWFQFFHIPIGEGRTEREVEFICAVAPLPQFRNALDLCCGMGRHARALAARGYSVTAVDRDSGAIKKASELGGGPKYIHADIRNYQPAKSTYDLAIVMSQSFGHFDSKTNRDILSRLASGFRKGGRIALDLWNPEFFAAHQGERDFDTAGGIVRENKHVEAGRLFVRLTYPDGVEETFEWQLFTSAQMQSLAEAAGLTLTVACTDFNAATKPNSANPRIQFVLEKL